MTTEPFNIAFKEWASVCAALAAGGQSLILRKGGIAEEGGRFRPQHPRFWLYPTEFHQAEDQLRSEAARYFAAARAMAPSEGQLPIGLFAVVTGVHWFGEHDLPQIERLAELHFWSAETIRKRFEYRRPGLTLLAVRIYRRTPPQRIIVTPEYEGCKTWVELQSPLSAEDLQPALDDAAFEAFQQRLTKLAPITP